MKKKDMPVNVPVITEEDMPMLNRLVALDILCEMGKVSKEVFEAERLRVLDILNNKNKVQN